MHHLKIIWAMTLSLFMLAGCATPPPVKEALVSVDQAYKDNETLMHQYKDLVSQINARHEKWYRIVNNRALLGTTLAWMTTDPFPPGKVLPQDHVDLVATVLGPELVQIINDYRLEGLPLRSGKNKEIFVKGQRGRTTDRLITAIPKLVSAIEIRTTEMYDEVKAANNLKGFTDYKTNIAVLMKMNSTIKQYLDIDLTIKSDDITEIAKAIKQLQ